jgi:glutathione S-transferase
MARAPNSPHPHVMTFEYMTAEEAMGRGGLRMVVVGGVPSPWGEAAKAIFHIEGLPWTAVRLAYDDEVLAKWAGQRSGPIVFYEDDRPRSGWAEILLLAERLAPTPRLLPEDPAARALVFGLAHELVGEEGLAWSRRLHLVHLGLEGAGGFPEPVARYLAKKYGYRAEASGTYPRRVTGVLRMLAARLAAQRDAGSPYYVGKALSAADVYGAAVMALFAPLPRAECAMDEKARAAFEMRDAALAAALDPILLEHRDRMYAEHLELPLSL